MGYKLKKEKLLKIKPSFREEKNDENEKTG